MSNVDAVSLPAALDPGRNALAVNVNHQSFPKPPSPSKKLSQPTHPSEDDALKKDDPAGDGDAPFSPKADSEAETIIQSGRESLSPEKRRKYVTHEPKRYDDRDENVATVERDSPNEVQSRKRRVMDDDSLDGRDRDERPSSPSPRPKSPAAVKVEKVEGSHLLPSKPPAVETTEPLPRSEENRTSRKRSFSESVDGDKEYRVNQPPPPVAPAHRGRSNLNGVSLPRPASNDRSVSPMRPSHSRTSSGQQLGGDSHRTKKAPAPLITGFHRQGSEDRISVSSSASGSPLPGAHLRKFASVDGASASPAKQPMGHKKQRDQNGRTRLARACAAQELEVAVARLSERPEDLNVPDNAGNTPLQIAALEGCAPIVKFLLEAGCEIDTKNIDKDTPLIDAVENGHLDVVKLLLDAGANPRTLNAEGDEPYELVPSDIDEYEEIRRALSGAKEKGNSKANRRSEDRPGPKDRSRRTSANSPRESPTMSGPRSPPLFGATTKRRTVRSEATRNDLLWTKATPENLREFASKGDIAGVANILNVGQKADAESLIAATKGGHDEVLSLLLGMGDADPDPKPLQGGYQKPGYNTPMLAAIGRGNLAVIRLLLDQPGFNPTRRLYRDRTYFELSKERKAENWEEEYDLLKAAYDNFGKAGKHRKPDGSSPRRARERERENKRPARRDSPSPIGRPRKPGSPNRTNRESYPKDVGPSKERKRELLQSRDRPVQGRPKTFHREDSDNPAASSDPDASRLESARPNARPSARRDSEPSGASRGDEAPKRRRLIAGRPPQDRQRRPSLISSDSLSGRDEGPRRADSPPGAASSKNGGPRLKRVRSSESPERLRGPDSERHAQELQKKKRRVVSEEGPPKIANGGLKKHPVEDTKPHRPPSDDAHSKRRMSDRSNSPSVKDTVERKSPERNVVKEEREKHERNDLGDIPMEDATNAESQAKKAEEEAEQRRREEARKAEEERVAEEKRQAAEAERARLAKEEQERAARLAREKAEDEERRRKEAEQRRIKQAEDERQKRIEQERLRIEKARREQEEQERRRRAALPNRLRIAANLIGSSDPRARSRVWLKKFMPVVLTDTKQLDPKCEPDAADEKWVPNFLVAPLLATNDLQLSQYASWEKRNATTAQRMNLWRVTRRMLTGADDNEFVHSSVDHVLQKDNETQPRYFDLEHVFWVKLSDFMDLVPHIPHLHGLNIKFIKMDIGQQPLADSAFGPRVNGHVFGTPPADDRGLMNGFGFSRPSTYA